MIVDLRGHDNPERERKRLTLKKSGRNVDVTAVEQWRRHRVAELEALSLSLCIIKTYVLYAFVRAFRGIKPSSAALAYFPVQKEY